MYIRLLGILVAAATASTGAQAENWRSSSTGMGATAYIDTDSIRREGNSVQFWRQLRWAEPRTFTNGTRYDRLSALYEADCEAMTLRALEIEIKLGDHVILSDKQAGPRESAAPGSTAGTDLRAACFGEWPADELGGAVQAPNASQPTVDVTASVVAYRDWRLCLDERLGPPPRRRQPKRAEVEAALVACQSHEETLRTATAAAFGPAKGAEIFTKFATQTRAELGIPTGTR